MNKVYAAALLSLIAPFTLSNANPPPNLHEAKQAMVRYHDSGAYKNDVQTIATMATNYVKNRVKTNAQSAHPKKLAAVFDIDETVLSNYPDLVRMHFGGTTHAANLAENAGKDKAIKPVKQLYNVLKANNVTIFFVTGRASTQKEATIKNLKAAGFKGYKGLYLKPNQYPYNSAIPYKSSIRKKITEQGYDIIFSMGDQWSDLKGGYADKTFKLPNPFYYIP